MKNLYLFLFIIKCGCNILALQNSSVSLTVEGGVSLVGEHCPGTVRLFCEGVNLVHLRWIYNGNNYIYSFLSDSDISPTPIPLSFHPAFLSVQLTDVSSQFIAREQTNFSSVLTVDVEQLQTQGIIDISCGDVITFETIQVDPIIIQETTPKVSSISACYHSGLLNSLQISWIKLQLACPEYMLAYIVGLTGSQSIQVNYSTCGSLFCIGIFENITRNVEDREHKLTLVLTNTHPSGDSQIIDSYETVKYIARNSDYYFSITHTHDGCKLRGVCTSPLSASTIAFCSVVYLNNLYQILLRINASLDEQYTLTSTNINFYEAWVEINDSEVDEVTNRRNFTIEPSYPEILSVVVLYSNRGELKVIQVDWVNIASVCGYRPIQYDLSIRYNEMETLSTAEIQSNECTPAICTAKIVIATEFLTASLRIFLTATNSGGTSTHEFVSPIHQFSALYYRPSIKFLNCAALQINCFSSIRVRNDTHCVSNYYGRDPLYQQIQSTQDLISNNVLTLQDTITSHYFLLKWNVSDTLQLQEEFVYNTRHTCSQGMDEFVTTTMNGIVFSKEIIIGISIGLTSLVCLLSTVIIVVIAVVLKRQKISGNKTISNDTGISMVINNSEKSPSPVYEEIDELRFKQIEVNRNEAYARYTQEAVYYNTRS